MRTLKALRWKVEFFFEKHFGGHISVGPVTVFGLNAMHGAIEIKTERFGYITIFPPLYWSGHYQEPGIVVSPNGTPAKATFIWGRHRDISKAERVAAHMRRIFLGHNNDEVFRAYGEPPYQMPERLSDLLELIVANPQIKITTDPDAHFVQVRRDHCPRCGGIGRVWGEIVDGEPKYEIINCLVCDGKGTLVARNVAFHEEAL